MTGVGAGWVGFPNDLPYVPASRSAHARQATPGLGEEGSAQRQNLARVRAEGSQGRWDHAQRDPSALGAEDCVRGRDTGTAQLLIGHRRQKGAGPGERAL